MPTFRGRSEITDRILEMTFRQVHRTLLAGILFLAVAGLISGCTYHRPHHYSAPHLTTHKLSAGHHGGHHRYHHPRRHGFHGFGHHRFRHGFGHHGFGHRGFHHGGLSYSVLR